MSSLYVVVALQDGKQRGLLTQESLLTKRAELSEECGLCENDRSRRSISAALHSCTKQWSTPRALGPLVCVQRFSF